MLFPQVCLKQYAGLHVDALVVQVVCIRVSFAIRPSQFSLLINRWHRIWKNSYKNENCFVFYPKLTSNLMSARRFTKFSPMIHFACPTTHIIDIHLALYPFPCTVNFSFWRDYQVCQGFSNKYQNELSDLSLLLENQNQSLRNAF